MLASQINELSQVATGPLPAADPHEVRILHISDVHLNPLGLEIARNLADTFAVDGGDRHRRSHVVRASTASPASAG